MSEQNQETGIINAINRFRSASDDHNVTGAQSDLEDAISERSQADENYTKKDENVSERTDDLNAALKAKRTQQWSSINEGLTELCAKPFRIVAAIMNVGDTYPKTAATAAIAAVVAWNTVDTNDIEYLKEQLPSAPTTTLFQNDNIQVATVPNPVDGKDAKWEAARLSKKHPSIEFKAVGNTVQSPNSCTELISAQVLTNESACVSGMTLAKR